MPTVLVSPGPLRNQAGQFREILRSAGFDFIDPPGDHQLTDEELRAVIPRADAMLAGSELIYGEVLDLAPRLRAIARTGVGYDAVDVPAATARRIPVMIAPGTNQGSVAEMTFALLLAVARDVVKNDRLVHSGGWSRKLVTPLRGKTMGLLGLGRIGRAVATRALAFEMKVVAHDPLADTEFAQRHGIALLDFDELLKASDILSIHSPLTPQTRGIINRAALAKMRRGSYLLNTARGALVVEADLHEALVSGHIAGAGLDVLNHEPPEPGNPLLGLPNVVISPHLGGVDTKSMSDMAELAASCIVSLYQGKWPTGCVVNDELANGWTW
jgi:phosphoglycerate dehydrogenase-like enzyme